MHGRFLSFRAWATLVCVPAVGLAVVAGAGSAASAARVPAHPRADVRIALEHALAHWRPTNIAVPSASPKQVKSLNWSGYADLGTVKYTKISSSWVQPKGKCGTAQSLAVFWVGIDGFTSKTVEQDGTGIFCQGGGAAPLYFTWWEMFPANNVQVVGQTVKPGDHIAASVVRVSTKYTLKVTDSTTGGNSFSTAQTCAATTCKDTSAEFIAERPTNGSTGQLFPLVNFGTWNAASAAVTAGTKAGTISSFPDDEITMVNSSGKVLAQPGPLNASGNAFKVTWKAAK
jgi:peptidase A4-like protein